MTTPYIIFSKKHCNFMRPCVAENYGFIKYELPFINALAIEVPEEKAETLRRHHLVAMMARDGSVSKLPCGEAQSPEGPDSAHHPIPNHAYQTQSPQTARTLHAPRTPRTLSLLENKGFGTTIAVIDTGVAPHYDLVKPYNRIVAFKDFLNNHTEPYDDDGHGTHVAGIAAGNGYCSSPYYAKNASLNCDAHAHYNTHSLRSTTGTAPMANIAALKALDENGSGATSDILAAMQWIADNKEKYNIRVVNLSLGINVYDDNTIDPLVIATTALTAMGILVVTAAGNSGPGRCTITSPGINPLVLTVGSCHNGRVAEFSSRGPTLAGIHKPDLVAPGVDIVSLDAKTGKNYVSQSGTSMSCPYASGVAACIFSAQPSLTPRAVKSIISKMLTPLHGLPRDIQGRGALLDFRI